MVVPAAEADSYERGAGFDETASALVAAAEQGPLSDVERAHAARLRALIVWDGKAERVRLVVPQQVATVSESFGGRRSPLALRYEVPADDNRERATCTVWCDAWLFMRACLTVTAFWNCTGAWRRTSCRRQASCSRSTWP